MNCWLWIILLSCAFGRSGCGCMDGGGCGNRGGGCGGNHGKGGSGCMDRRDRDNDTPCRPSFTSPVSSNNGCGCGDDIMMPRGFAGFGDGGTCGCEEKCEKS